MSGLHRLNSRELVDLQKDGFKYDPGQYAYLDPRERVNPVWNFCIRIEQE